MSRTRGLRWWLARLFGRGRWLGTTFNVAGVIGGTVTCLDLLSRFGGWVATPPMVQFRVYLWTTFIAATALAMAFMVLYRAVYRDLQTAERDVTTRERAIKLQHRMAEEVRCSAELGRNFLCRERLHKVGAEIVALLRQRLDGEGYAVTIKHGNLAQNQLEAVFRDGGQESKRKQWDCISLADSVVYQRFRQETAGSRRYVLIRDTERLSEIPYRERARACGYRSVVAFPLREPMIFSSSRNGESDPIKCANLIGFMSIDAPFPDAFANLFMPPPKDAPQREDGEDLEPRDDIELFYGLADAIATILVLQRDRVGRANGGSNGNG